MRDDQSYPSKPRMLCVRSKAADPLLQEVLRYFAATVIHDARQALRKGMLGTYDIFLAYDPHSARRAAFLWESIRRVDVNTPFVMVCGADMPPQSAGRLLRGFDVFIRLPCGLDELLQAIRRVLAEAEKRNVLARSDEVRAISEEIRGRLTMLEQRVRLSRQSLARAQEHVVRAIALRSFTSSGGTRSHFEQVWPTVFEAALAASYGEQEDARGGAHTAAVSRVPQPRKYGLPL